MLQTVKLKHFLNKWKVSSNLDFFFVLFVLTRTQGSSTCGFYLNKFLLVHFILFFSLQHHYANIPSKLGSRHTDVKGLLRVFFFSKWRICTPIREIQCKNNEKGEILYYVNCPFSYDKKNLPWFWLFSNDRK